MKINDAQGRAFVAALNNLCKEHGISIAITQDGASYLEPLISSDDRWVLTQSPADIQRTWTHWKIKGE